MSVKLGLGLGIAGVGFFLVRKFLMNPLEVGRDVVDAAVVQPTEKLFDLGAKIGNLSFKAVFPKSLGDYERDKFNNIQESYAATSAAIGKKYASELAKLNKLANNNPELVPQISGARARLKVEYDNAMEESRRAHTEEVEDLNEATEKADKLYGSYPLVRTARFIKGIF